MMAMAMRPAKKATGLEWENNDFARSSCFFVHFFTVVARPQLETSSFCFLKDVNTRRQFSFSFSELRYSQLSLRRTPLGPALSVRLREVSVL